MADEPMTLSDVQRWLQEKIDAGVKQVRVTSVLAALPDEQPDYVTGLVARVRELEDELADSRAETYSAREAHERYLEENAPADLPEGLTRAQRRRIATAELVARAGENPKTYDTREGVEVTASGLLVGTAEAAAILGVERPRIGRYRGLAKKMLPDPIAELAAGPVWLRSDIEAMVSDMVSRRKPRKGSAEQVTA